MVRPLLAVVALAGSAGAAGLPKHLGMYPTQGAPLAMLDTKITVTIRGPIVEAIVTQRFRNDTNRATEATYIFPLPDDAAVSAMSIAYGARTIHAAIEKRGDAQRRYEQAIAAGVGAALLDQERPDVFTQTVSAIPPQATVDVTIRFDATARYDGGAWQLALPLVVAPRYVPGSASGRPTTGGGRAPDTDRAPDASRVTPGGAPGAGGAVDIAIAFADEVDDVQSPTHELRGDHGRFALRDPHGDHDAIVRWRAKASSLGWIEQDNDGAYAAVVVTAPPPSDKAAAAARCLAIIHVSSTTRGDAEASLRPIAEALAGGGCTAQERGEHDLTKLLAGTRASGRGIVLVSDGLVADDAAAIAAAKKLGAPLHVIAVGPAPNRSLLAQIAAQTGGTLRVATVGDDAAAIARAVIADLAAPPQPLAVNWGELAASDVVPAIVPRIGAGQAAVVVARVARAVRASARARGDVFVLASIDAPARVPGAITAKGPLARRWARLKLDELLADPNAASAHALRHGLVSPFTSMVAIGDEVVVQGGVKHTVAVPVSVPAGMRWQEVRRAITVDTTTVDQEQADEAPKPTKPATESKHERSRDDDGKKRKTGDRGGGSAPKKKAGKAAKTAKERPAEPSPQPPPRATPTGGATRPAQDKSVAREERDNDAGDDGDAANVQAKTLRPPAADYGEAVQVSGVYLRRRVVRITAGLAFGYAAINNGQSGALGGLDARVEVGGRTLAGVDGSLWLVGGGLHLHGELLATFARAGVLARWLELGAGVGVRIGDGAGPAASASLRVVPPRLHGRFAVFGRYDGALRFHASTYDGENIFVGGIEWRW